MVEDFNNNDNSIYQAKICPEDFSASEELSKLQGAAEEFARQAALKRLECERQASTQIDSVLSRVQSHIEGGDDYFTSGIDGLLDELYDFFKHSFNEFGVEMDLETYRMMKEKKEENWLAAIIKFLRNKFKKLIKAIFSRDLSFDEKIDKEIKELEAKLGSGELSEEEFARVLERLDVLQNLKLKLQMFMAGWIISALGEFFAVDLTATIETGTSKEEDKKTSSKEATKEACENVEIKVDEREKPQPIYGVIPALDDGIWLKKTIPLTKPEFGLLRDPMENIVGGLSIKLGINYKGSEGKTESVEQGKKAEKLEEAVCPPKPSGQGRVASKLKVQFYSRFLTNKEGRHVSDAVSNINSKGVPATKSTNATQSANEQKIDDLCAEFAKELANFKMTTWKGVEHELQQSSTGNAQEKVSSGVTDIKVDKGIEGQSAGKTP